MDIAFLGNGTVANGLLTHIETLNETDRAVFSIRSILLKPYEICPNPVYVNSIDTILADDQIEIVVEMMGGRHPAYDYVKAAILAKKHVVTSNKELVSTYGAELARLAVECNVAFFFSAAVGGGIPLLMYLRDTSKQETIHEITGILNGTTNFILDAMTRKNIDFEEALKQAQELGYAEADPTNDVQGLDLAYKLRVASCVAFGKWIDQESILRLPLHHVTSRDIEFLRKRNLTLRYLVHAGISKDWDVFASIQPTALPHHCIEAQILRNNNIFTCRSERNGEIDLIGQGAGAAPTAANIYRDLKRILNGERELITGTETITAADNSGLKMRYYLRMSKLAAQEFSLQEVMESFEDDNTVVLLTHRVKASDLVDEVNRLNAYDPTIFAAAIQEEKEGE